MSPAEDSVQPATPLEATHPGVLSSSDVMQAERTLLFGDASPDIATPKGVGLAFSGGGIRSASFGLGVFQAILGQGLFSKFDYLSTVSGGGYLGSALSWLSKQSADPASPLSGSFERQFGSAAMGVRSGSGGSLAAGIATPPDRVWLDFIRTHGNYLQPPGISSLGLIATVLRGALFTLTTYAGLLTAIIAGLILIQALPMLDGGAAPWLEGPWYRIESWALLFGLLFGLSVALYGTATWLASIPIPFTVVAGPVIVMLAGSVVYGVLDPAWLPSVDAQGGFNWRWPIAAAFGVIGCTTFGLWVRTLLTPQHTPEGRSNQAWHYRARVAYTQYLGAFCGLFLAVLGVWSIPYIDHFLDRQLKSVLATATLSSVLGAAGGVYQFFAGRSQKGPATALGNLRIVLSAALLIYGLALLAFTLAEPVAGDPSNILLYSVLGVTLVGGLLINTNYFGLSRMYRDRLMETFMPNAQSIATNQWAPATEADQAALQDFRVSPAGIPRRPLHLINCNAVMVDSPNDRYRGRGGDSFMLSPCFSGSDATGWVATGNLGDGTLTLATAVATSGAAANPDAGVAGAGVTRNRLVAFLMSILNVRLGYWIQNPRSRSTFLRYLWPNLWWPGLRQGLFARGLNESAAFIELTDGGHFENTALYELIRRRVKLIIVAEAGQDKHYQMDDLANAIERVRVDFGTHIRFDDPAWDLSALRPDPATGLATRGFAIGTIRYPAKDQPAQGPPKYESGTLLYLQPTPVADMHPDTDSYRRRHTDFPNQSTADQFYSEEQLEAYRELGLRIGRSALDAIRSATTAPTSPLRALHTLLTT